MDKVKRPTISLAGTSEDWKYFLCRWEDYATATKITGRDKVVQLLECCDEQLRKDLTRSAGTTLTQKPEDDVLAAIKSLAVKEENIMVARVTLNDMRQDRDESIRSFGARIRGQANVCKYVINCHECYEEVNYTEAILRDVLCRGIDDPEIQLDLLGDLNQDMTVEEMFRFVEVKEAGKRSASRIASSVLQQASRNIAEIPTFPNWRKLHHAPTAVKKVTVNTPLGNNESTHVLHTTTPVSFVNVYTTLARCAETRVAARRVMLEEQSLILCVQSLLAQIQMSMSKRKLSPSSITFTTS